MSITYQQYIDALSIIDEYKRQESSKIYKVNKTSLLNDDEVKNQISVKLFNVIQRNCESFGIKWNEKFGISLCELEKFSISELKKIRGVGYKTIYDLNQLCNSAEITLQP